MEEIHEITKPTDETTAIVKNWLVKSGVDYTKIENATPNGDFLRVRTTIEFAEELLECEYYDYTNKIYPNALVARVDHESYYHVPSLVSDHLDFVSPTHRFPSPMRINASNYNNDLSPDAANTPAVLRELYAVGSTTGKASNNIQGVAQFLEQYYSSNDVNIFWKRYDVPATNITNVPSDQPSGHGAEAELDIQYITSLGEMIPTQVWYTPGRAPNNKANEPFLTWLTDVESASNPPVLFSVSYGEDEKSVGMDYASRVNTEFAKLGTNGTSFLFASGDSGAGGNCTGSKGRECPNYPTGSPYVTSVGGTRNTKPEIAWSGSGGGFSDYWPTQSWQQAAVTAYFTTAANKLPAQAKWNQTGRGYPDVAAQSVDFTIIDGGVPIGVSGTSCATPTAGGIFSLLNDLRLQKNMAPLGFLNPFIYETAAKDATAFNDIIAGQNTGCGGEGFPAVKAWDAVTGYGTPDYAKLATY
eukprot:508593_1